MVIFSFLINLPGRIGLNVMTHDIWILAISKAKIGFHYQILCISIMSCKLDFDKIKEIFHHLCLTIKQSLKRSSLIQFVLLYVSPFIRIDWFELSLLKIILISYAINIPISHSLFIVIIIWNVRQMINHNTNGNI